MLCAWESVQWCIFHDLWIQVLKSENFLFRQASIFSNESKWPMWLACIFFFLLFFVSLHLTDLMFFFWQILHLYFSISLSLPRPANSSFTNDIESSYSALSSLEDVIAILRSVSFPNASFCFFLFLLCKSLPAERIIKWQNSVIPKYLMRARCNTLVFLFHFASSVYKPFYFWTHSYFQDASIDPSEVFNRVVSSVCILLTKDEVSFSLL